MRTTSYLAISLCTILSTVQSFAQLGPSTFKKLDSLLQTSLPRPFNGVILITEKGKTTYTRALGHADLENSTPIKLTDRFRIQSNSKQVTAVLILLEMERGKIDLHRPIKKYLPQIAQSWTDTVTVHQLLNMSAGISQLDRPLAFRPGTGFLYSNPAYGLLGKILENVTGKPYTDMANELFKNLGMASTYCYAMDGENPGLIKGYMASASATDLVDFHKLGFTTASWKNFLPGGGIISNAADLNSWDHKLHHGDILKPNSYRLMTNSEVIDTDYTFSEQKSNYGYGVNINSQQPPKYIGHAGRGLGFVSLKFYVPEKDLDVVILENIYHRDINIVYHFEREIRRIVIDGMK
jgi:CubicO group peptidase (beta-lactamase class C family)